MQQVVSDFEIIYREAVVPVRELFVAGRAIFVVMMATGGHLVLTRATDAEGHHFWTCVPENPQRQAVVDELGTLIESYTKKVV